MSLQIQNEPAVTIGSIVAAANAVLVVLVAFGAINDQQFKALAGLCSTALPVAGAALVRSRVVPTAKLALQTQQTAPEPGGLRSAS